MKIATALLLLFFSFAVMSQNAGDLDFTFGIDGKVTTNIGESKLKIERQAIQPDGKIVLVGQKITNFGNYNGIIIRLNSDGTIDNTFNSNGRILNLIANNFYAVKIQTDGKILVAGDYLNKIVLARYNTDGSPDTSFNATGIIYATDQYGPNNNFIDFDLQSDGKIVALCQHGYLDYEVSRYNLDGSLDSTFGNGGKIVHRIVTDVWMHAMTPSAIEIPSDDTIVVGGKRDSDLFVSKLLPNGFVDNSFATNGSRVLNLPGAVDVYLSGLATSHDGGIVFSSRAYFPSSGTVTATISLGKLNANGTSNNTFASNGNATMNFPISGYATIDRYSKMGRLKIGSDGRIVLLENIIAVSDQKSDILVTKYNQDGSPDTTFHSDGTLIYSYNGLNDTGSDFDFVGNSILISGNTDETPKDNKIAISKINDAGNFDVSFSGDGKAYIALDYGDTDGIDAAVLQPDGKIVVGGRSHFNATSFHSIMRYNSDGSVDSSFGTNGRVIITSGIFDIDVDGNGKIVGNTVYEAKIFRFNADGSFDTGFGLNGTVNLPGNFTAFALKTLPDNKILIAGSSSVYDGTSDPEYDYALVRLNEDGSLDSTFGSGGISLEGSSDDIYEQIFKIELLPDQKIIAYGEFSDDVRLLKYNANGTLDTTFGNDGKATFGDEEYNIPYDLAIGDGKIFISYSVYDENLPFLVSKINADGSLDVGFENIRLSNWHRTMKISSDQKILLGGSILNGANAVDFALKRFNVNGTIDATFGNQGTVTTDFYHNDDAGSTLLITPDNKALLLGAAYTSSETNDLDYAIAKYFLDTNLSFPDHNKNMVTFYPNPVKNELYLSKEVQLLEIYSLEGRKITESKEYIVDLSKLPSGIYMAKITLDDKSVVIDKLIKN